MASCSQPRAHPMFGDHPHRGLLFPFAIRTHPALLQRLILRIRGLASIRCGRQFRCWPNACSCPRDISQPGSSSRRNHDLHVAPSGSRYYPGVARDAEPEGMSNPKNAAQKHVATHPAPFTRTVTFYVPAQYVPGTASDSPSATICSTRARSVSAVCKCASTACLFSTGP